MSLMSNQSKLMAIVSKSLLAALIILAAALVTGAMPAPQGPLSGSGLVHQGKGWEFACLPSGFSCDDKPVLIDMCGDPMCDQFCKRCYVHPAFDRMDWRCVPFQEVFCKPMPGAECHGVYEVDLCSFGGLCGAIWWPTTKDCSFAIGDCRTPD